MTESENLILIVLLSGALALWLMLWSEITENVDK